MFPYVPSFSREAVAQPDELIDKIDVDAQSIPCSSAVTATRGQVVQAGSDGIYVNQVAGDGTAAASYAIIAETITGTITAGQMILAYRYAHGVNPAKIAYDTAGTTLIRLNSLLAGSSIFLRASTGQNY